MDERKIQILYKEAREYLKNLEGMFGDGLGDSECDGIEPFIRKAYEHGYAQGVKIKEEQCGLTQ